MIGNVYFKTKNPKEHIFIESQLNFNIGEKYSKLHPELNNKTIEKLPNYFDFLNSSDDLFNKGILFGQDVVSKIDNKKYHIFQNSKTKEFCVDNYILIDIEGNIYNRNIIAAISFYVEHNQIKPLTNDKLYDQNLILGHDQLLGRLDQGLAQYPYIPRHNLSNQWDLISNVKKFKEEIKQVIKTW